MPANSSRRSNISSVLILTAVLLLAGCSSATRRAATVDSSAWPTFLNDNARTNLTRSSLTPPLEKSWSNKIAPFEFLKGYPEEQSSTPVVSEGVLYVGSTDKTFYAFDIAGGVRLWKLKTGEFLESIATARDNRVCFGSSDGVFRCLDRGEGRELWRFQTDSEIISSPLILSNLVFVYSADDRLYAFDIRTGEKIWRHNHTGAPNVSLRSHRSPASSVDGKRIYQEFSDGMLICLDAATGRAFWKKKLFDALPPPGRYRRTPLVHEKTLYVIGESLSVLAVDSKSGKIINRYDQLKARDYVVTRENVLVIAGDRKIVALNTSTGDIIWEKTVTKGSTVSMMASGKRIFVITRSSYKVLGLKFFTREKGYLLALDTKDGTTLWEKSLSSTISSNAISAAGRMAFFTDKGVVEVWAEKGSLDGR
ncbi:MAG: hypothetical protein BMS9Abin23_1070 [Thermodesulfobacteriota bacterium]|nr:MAG: hypothetical protein BMS9Abin23_1070 [Thermodesulfobacteriota bacterium]